MQQFSINLGLDIVPITKDNNNLGDIYRLYNACKVLAGALDTYTGALEPDSSEWSVIPPMSSIRIQNLTKVYVMFSEDVGAGYMVQLWNDAGTLKAKKALAGNVQGFAVHTVTLGNWGVVCLQGLCTQISGLTLGSTYYASNTTDGFITAIKPTTPGKIVQTVGFALASNMLYFNPNNMPVTL